MLVATRNRAQAVEEAAFGLTGVALVDLESEVAAKQRLALIGDAGGDRRARPN